MKRLDLNLLTALDVLLAEGSVSRAAVRLNLTQSAVSAILARLRVAFGDPLLLRTARGMLPTPRAQELVLPLHRILADIDQLVEPTSAFDPATAELTFTLSAFDYMQYGLIPPLADLLKREAPRIRLQLRQLEFAKIAKQLETGEVDLCITSTVRNSPQLYSKPLYTEHIVCVARKDHPKLRKRLTLEQFCAIDHIILNPSRVAEKTDEVLASMGRSRRIGIVLPDFYMFLETVRASDMIGMMPSRLAMRYTEQLQIFQPPFRVETFTLAALWHPRSHMSPAHRWLRERVIAIMSDDQKPEPVSPAILTPTGTRELQPKRKRRA